MEVWTSCAQACASGPLASPSFVSRDCGRRGGGLLPGEGLPPPSRSGLVLTRLNNDGVIPQGLRLGKGD